MAKLLQVTLRDIGTSLREYAPSQLCASVVTFAQLRATSRNFVRSNRSLQQHASDLRRPNQKLLARSLRYGITTPPAGLEPAIFGLEVRRLVH